MALEKQCTTRNKHWIVVTCH